MIRYGKIAFSYKNETTKFANATPIISNLNVSGSSTSPNSFPIASPGQNITSKFSVNTAITEIVKGKFVYIGFQNGFEMEKFMTEITY